MLPRQIITLTDRFVRVFDSERPPSVEFKRAHDLVAESGAEEGTVADVATMVAIGNHVTAYVEERVQFIWKKMREAVALTQTTAYPELNSDLKAQIVTYHEPVRQAAERYMEELRRSADAPTSYAAETRKALDKILANINAEIDLFYAKYLEHKNRKKQVAATQASKAGNSRAPAYPAKAPRLRLARQLLVDHTIPKEDRALKLLLAVFSLSMLGLGAYLAYAFRKQP